MAAPPKLKQYTHPHPDSPPRPHLPSSPSLLTHTYVSLSLSVSLSASTKTPILWHRFCDQKRSAYIFSQTHFLPPPCSLNFFSHKQFQRKKKVEELKQTKNAQTTNNKQRTKQTLLRFVACSSGSNSNNFENEKKGKSHSLSSIYELLRT